MPAARDDAGEGPAMQEVCVMDLNELIEAAADAWDEPTHNITIDQGADSR